jgi:alkane 1-monooxygenase
MASWRPVAETLVRFGGPLSYAASVPFLYFLHPLAPLLAAAILPLALLVAEIVTLPRGGASNKLANRVAVWLTIAAQLALIGWGAVMAADPERPGIGVLVFTIGIGSGVFGMLAAHEMIHSRNRFEIALGLLMLTGMTYRHFRISHLHGHHRWAATSRDPATARRGEGAYAFLWRSVTCQLSDAISFEQERLGNRQAWRNRLIHDAVIYAAVYAAIYAVLGWRGASFFAAQSLLSIAVLELFNYVAHYGLIRRVRPNGGLEPLSDLHSWNAPAEIGNWLLLDMGHHSDHHCREAPPRHRDLPVLPGGYAGAILLALVPPLWRRRMDGRVERWMGSAMAPETSL